METTPKFPNKNDTQSSPTTSTKTCSTSASHEDTGNGSTLTSETNLIQNEDGTTNSSSVAGDVCKIFGAFFAILVRLLLVAFCLITVYFVVENKNDSIYWLLTMPIGLIVVEGAYTVKQRGGQERKWVCFCFVSYLGAIVPPMWILQLDDLSDNKNTSASRNVSVIEQILIFLLILCRWLLPRGPITRDQLSQLMFVFIGMASDVMDLFQLFEEQKVKDHSNLTYIILAAWSVSLLQFTLVLTMCQSPKKAEVVHDMPDERQGVTSRVKEKFLGTEVWSLLVSIFMQDGPFLAIRTYTMVHHNLMNYSIVFYTCKNILVVCLLLYRLVVIFVELEGEEAVEEKTRVNKKVANNTMYQMVDIQQPGVSSPKKQSPQKHEARPPDPTPIDALTPSTTPQRRAKDNGPIFSVSKNKVSPSHAVVDVLATSDVESRPQSSASSGYF